MSGLCAEQKMLMVRLSPLIISSGFLLCFHYGAWVESIETTSLAHAVLAVSTSPIFLAIGAWILRKPISYGKALLALNFHFCSQLRAISVQATRLLQQPYMWLLCLKNQVSSSAISQQEGYCKTFVLLSFLERILSTFSRFKLKSFD